MDTLAPDRLAAIADKLEQFLGGDRPQFTREDAEALRRASTFVGAFNADPAQLKAMQDAFVSVQGFVKVGTKAGYLLGFLVLVLVNWTRLMEWFGRGPSS